MRIPVPALAEARTVILEVDGNFMLARLEGVLTPEI
jgi:hypothetical protein